MHILRRHDDRPVFGAQARQRLVEAQFALRQADDRLQIEIDAVFLQRGADGFEQIGFAQRVEIGAGGVPRAPLDQFAGLGGGLRAFGDAGGEFPHQPFEHLQFRDDLAALLIGAGFGPGLDVFDLEMGFFERPGELRAGAFEIGDLALSRAALAEPQDRAMELAAQEHGDEPEHDRAAGVADADQHQKQRHGGGRHGVDRENQGVGHAPPCQPVDGGSVAGFAFRIR